MVEKETLETKIKYVAEDEFKYFQDNFDTKRNAKEDTQNQIQKDENFKNKYKEDSDMFYCDSDNKLNGKKCQKGNELCVSCQLINQAYHKLKNNYLINRAGRACTYRKGKMFCLGELFKNYQNENMTFQSRFKCNGKNAQCEPCKEMQKYIKEYYGETLYNSIIKRDNYLGY